MKRVGIIGAGLAGMSCAKRLRELGFTGEISVFNGEKDAPYEKPGLSKGRIGCSEPTPIPIPNVEMNGAALSLDAECRVVETVRGQSLPFDRILIATGRIPVVVEGLEAAITCRTREDMRALRSRLTPQSRILIIGAGLIGMELATALSAEVAGITVVEAGARAMARVVPAEIAEIMVKHAEQSGVEFLFSTSVRSIGNLGVQLSNGRALGPDIVISAIGAKPDLRLARFANLECSPDGICVGENLATSHAGIFAAGDVAAVKRGNAVFPCQNYAAAQSMGSATADAMMGHATLWQPDTWFWSDQGSLTLEGVGSASGEAIVVDHPDGGTSVAVMRDSRHVGQFAVGSRKALRSVRAARNIDTEHLNEGAYA